MAIGDFPRIPDGMNERIMELTRHVNENEISNKTIFKAMAAEAGKTRLDHQGIRTCGAFGEIFFDPDDLKALIKTGEIGIDLIHITNGSIFYIKTGKKIEKVKLFYIPIISEVRNIPEKDEEEVSIVEFLPDKDGNYPQERLPIIFSYLKKQFIEGEPVREPEFIIRNFEGFAGFLNDWKEFSLLLELPTTLLELTIKEKIQKTGESAIHFIENILTRCGV